MSKKIKQPIVVIFTLALFISVLTYNTLFNTQHVFAAGKTYYVDAVDGNDNNDGQSTQSAWQNLSKVNSTTFQPGDTILFKTDDIWSGQLHPLGSGSQDGGVITIDKYGSGNNPIINGGGIVGGTVYLLDQEYWEIRNLEITNTTTTRAYRAGVWIKQDTTSGFKHHIHLENLNIHDVYGETDGDPSDPVSGGIVVAGHADGNASSNWDDLLIQNNTVGPAVDENGICVCSDQADAGGRSTNVVIQNNTVTDQGGHGILAYEVTSPILQNNVVGNGGSRSNNNAQLWTTRAENSIIQNNEVYGSSPKAADGQAFDFDIVSKNTILQYNYSHDNSPGMVVFYDDGDTGNIVRYNISQRDGTTFNWVHNPADLQIYNNTIFSDQTLYYVLYLGSSGVKASVSNNIFYFTGDTKPSYVNYDAYSTDITWDHNVYYGGQDIPTNDPGILTSDPEIINPGGAGKGRDTASAYQLHAGSQALGSGVVIADNGGKDYFGNDVSSSSAPNRGAYNGAGLSGGDLAIGATPSASSTIDNYGWSLAQVNDGNRSSGWSSNDSLGADHTESVSLNFGSAKTFNEVDLYPRSDDANAGYGFPIDFTIDVSTNGQDWTSVLNKKDYANPGGSVQKFSLPAQNAQYVRVQGTKLQSNPNDNNLYRMQFYEFEVYNS